MVATRRVQRVEKQKLKQLKAPEIAGRHNVQLVIDGG